MPRRTRVKICGITNEKDARKLLSYDVFALGFIITEKNIPSRIDLDLATRIIKSLPSHILSVVGVANLPPEEIISLCRKTGTDVLQIQKGGTISDILKIRRTLPNLKIWKVIFTNKEEGLNEITTFEKYSDAILIHSKEKEWPIGLKITKVLKKPFILAGGLNLDNIERAILKFKPLAADLIRGVETIPGKKDFKKVNAFLEAVKKADTIVYKR